MKVCAIVVALLLTPAALQTQAPPKAPMFRLETDDFWLNLHHFLYVLGRAQLKTPDSSREAVANAPVEAERDLKTLNAEERRIWSEAVAAYAGTLSTLSTLQMPMPSIAIVLGDAKDTASLAGVRIDAAVRTVLESAAPIYRKTWWGPHRAQHQRFLTSLQVMIDRHGQGVHDFLTGRYGIAWPKAGYPVHFVAYASFQGNYSLVGPGGAFLVMSTNPNPANAGLLPLETVFHEGMHQWDGEVMAALRAAAPGVTIPQDLSHALIFFTSGEAIRRVDPTHVPYVDRFGIWKGRLSGSPLAAERLQGPIQQFWKPYLDGRGTRDEALAGLVVAVTRSQP
jgi:hypothetical protein